MSKERKGSQTELSCMAYVCVTAEMMNEEEEESKAVQPKTEMLVNIEKNKQRSTHKDKMREHRRRRRRPPTGWLCDNCEWKYINERQSHLPNNAGES